MNCCKEERSHLKEGEQAIVEDAKGENAGGGGVDQEELQDQGCVFYACFVHGVICGPQF